MASTAQDTMENIERRRAQLEDTANELRQAVAHWRQWELEYEMLKEEIQHAGSPSPSQMHDIGCNLGGRLVKDKEVEELLGKASTKRSANQVVDMISRRVDYVQQNLSTIENQLDTTEKQLAATLVLLDPGMVDEEGLPVMDIEEELDDDGNVISSSVSQPGNAASELVEALRKAGLHKVDLKTAEGAKVVEVDSGGDLSTDTPSALAPSAGIPTKTGTVVQAEPLPRKSVSFSHAMLATPAEQSVSTLEATGYNEMLDDFNWTHGTKVVEIDDDEQKIASYPIIPQDESLESAALRRQMLQYGLSEVGQVVAELDLDHPTATYSGDDLDDDYDEDQDSDEESEEEDQYGRSIRRVLTEDYENQMRELEEKLSARMMENVGPCPDLHPLAEHADDVHKLRIQRDDDFDKVMANVGDEAAESGPKKKGVRFADNLDISEVPEPVKDEARAPRSSVPTVSDTIVERSGPVSQPPTTPPKPARVSRFKGSRTSSSQPIFNSLPTPSVSEQPPVPPGPTGRTLAEMVVEHCPSPEPQAPDEFDPVLINREVQTQYHKMRNSMIQQQGGFIPTEEDEEDPLMEERDGKTKKVSRFRAARLKAEGPE